MSKAGLTYARRSEEHSAPWWPWALALRLHPLLPILQARLHWPYRSPVSWPRQIVPGGSCDVGWLGRLEQAPASWSFYAGVGQPIRHLACSPLKLSSRSYGPNGGPGHQRNIQGITTLALPRTTMRPVFEPPGAGIMTACFGRRQLFCSTWGADRLLWITRSGTAINR